MKTYHRGRVSVHSGDCREVLASLPENHFDSVVCDPPYHLTSIVKRFGAAGAKPAFPDQYGRLARGFMGKVWDGGDVAFQPDTWAAVLRVMKPGAHLLAFSGTRTFHRMACAIEDAGFEIRDAIMWHYGSGFPKSHDISKAIDRAAEKTTEDVERLKAELRRVFEASGLTLKSLNETCGFEASGYIRTSSTWAGVLPSPEKWWRMREAIGCDDDFSFQFKSIEREIIGRNDRPPGWFTEGNGHSITTPATDAARKWAGFGTALKPATEIICLARKPLSEPTIAANVLRWGTGAINIDGCRVATDENNRSRPPRTANAIYGGGNGTNLSASENNPLGRWPANLVHDGSEEVVSGFPESDGGGDIHKRSSPKTTGIYGVFAGDDERWSGFGDSGSAARFFATFPQEQSRFWYGSKAAEDDRLGARHPTVKPVALMQWLCRLITPPRGHILDCFAGTGTTAEAALREGFSCTLVEREVEYLADIERRMSLVFEGDVGRSVAMAKLKPEGEPLPLFAEAAE